jgi:hypothetical protein
VWIIIITKYLYENVGSVRTDSILLSERRYWIGTDSILLSKATCWWALQLQLAGVAIGVAVRVV